MKIIEEVSVHKEQKNLKFMIVNIIKTMRKKICMVKTAGYLLVHNEETFLATDANKKFHAKATKNFI